MFIDYVAPNQESSSPNGAQKRSRSLSMNCKTPKRVIERENSFIHQNKSNRLDLPDKKKMMALIPKKKSVDEVGKNFSLLIEHEEAFSLPMNESSAESSDECNKAISAM